MFQNLALLPSQGRTIQPNLSSPADKYNLSPQTGTNEPNRLDCTVSPDDIFTASFQNDVFFQLKTKENVQ
jgi:hypothetical protein